VGRISLRLLTRSSAMRMRSRALAWSGSLWAMVWPSWSATAYAATQFASRVPAICQPLSDTQKHVRKTHDRRRWSLRLAEDVVGADAPPDDM
jgi:hypothetical protein